MRREQKGFRKLLGNVLTVGLAVMPGVQGCIGRHVLDRKQVRQISEADQESRGRPALERARSRVREVRQGMSQGEVQALMGAVIVIEEGPEGDSQGQRKMMDGFLCKVNPKQLSEVWIFGYDEGNVRLVSFAVEFERPDIDDEDWTAKRVNQSPEEDCQVGGGAQLD